MTEDKQKKKYAQINDLGSIAENFIIAAIVAVIVVTFLDELATINDWGIKAKNNLIILGVIFDLLFTIEFAVRMFVNGRHGAAGHYFLHQRGWVDFLSSVPLLLLDSGPAFILFLFPELSMGVDAGLSFFGTLKVLKAIRVTRILRLLRLVKILGKIHNTDSHMANRHISVISTMAIMTIITSYSIFSFAGFLSLKNVADDNKQLYTRLIANAPRVVGKKSTAQFKTGKVPTKVTDPAGPMKKWLGKVFFDIKKESTNLMQVYYKNRLILENYTQAELKEKFHYFPAASAVKKKFADPHVHIIEEGDFTIVLNMHHIYEEQTKIQLVIFVSIMFMILIFMTFYTRHFVQNVTDVVHIMDKGFRDTDFLLEVKVREEFEEDEIYQLAHIYNEKYLPLKVKDQEQSSETDTGGLSLDDFMG